MENNHITDVQISKLKSIIISLLSFYGIIKEKKEGAKSANDKAFAKMMYHSPHHPVIVGIVVDIDDRTVTKWADKKESRTGENKAKDVPEVVYVPAGNTYRPIEKMEKGDVIFITYKNNRLKDRIVVGSLEEQKRLKDGFDKFNNEKGLRKKKEEKEKGKGK